MCNDKSCYNCRLNRICMIYSDEELNRTVAAFTTRLNNSYGIAIASEVSNAIAKVVAEHCEFFEELPKKKGVEE